MNVEDDARFPGSPPVSGAGDGVSPSRTFPEAQQVESAIYFRRRLPHFEKRWAIYAVTIKSFSAHEINKNEKKADAVWEKERFDRYVRSNRDLQEKFHYILRNPWDSGVAGQNEDYPWVWTQDDQARSERSFRRDAETNTRDARATQSSE
jgi:hypothetical protein